MIMKTILFSAVAIALFFGLYVVTLRRSNLFRLRRFYLIGTLAVSMIIPFVSIEIKVPQTTRVSSYVPHIRQSYETVVPQIAIQETSLEPAQTVAPITTIAPKSSRTWKDIVPIVYIIGCATAFIILVIKLIKTASYYRRSIFSEELSTREMRVRVLTEPDSNLPFSFLRSVFVNPEVFTESELQQVLRHERTHIRQRHTWDLLFTEAVRVMQWFNPFIYLYTRELSSVHEYLADEAVLSCGFSRRDYLELLYKQLCVGKFVPVGNSFRHLLTKKRIQMMNQPVKRRVSAWWLLALVPIIAGLLLVNCHPKTEMVAEEEAVEEVIDEPVCMDPDTMPQFPGGIQQYANNLYDSMQYPELSKKYKLTGLFTVRFVVEKDGRVLYTELDTAELKWKPTSEMIVAMSPIIGSEDSVASACFYFGEDTPEDKEARNEVVRQLMEPIETEVNRAFRAAPACKPAMKDGQPVRCRLRLPVAFTYGDHVTSDGLSGPRVLHLKIDTITPETVVVEF